MGAWLMWSSSCRRTSYRYHVALSRNFVPKHAGSSAALRRARLLDEESYETLDSGYRFLSNLEDRFRVMEHRSVNRLPLSGDKLRGLAVRLGYGEDGEEKLLDDYFRVTGSIRRLYTSFFGGHGKDSREELTKSLQDPARQPAPPSCTGLFQKVSEQLGSERALSKAFQ